MADKYDSADAWIDNSAVPWGETDFNNPEPGKTDTIRKSWWGTNRATNATWAVVRDIRDTLAGVSGAVGGIVSSLANLTTEAVRIRTYVGRIETKVDALSAKIDGMNKPSA